MSPRRNASRLSTRAIALLIALAMAVPAQAALTAYLMDIPAPDGNGQFSNLGAPILSNNGKMAFTATLTNTAGGGTSTDRFGLFSLEPGGVVTQIARGLQASPGGGEVFGPFPSSPLISGDGDVAFTVLREAATGQAGVYRGTPLTTIAERLDTAPNGNGKLLLFSAAGVNQAGQVAFSSTLSGTSPASADDGIFRGDGANLVEIVRSGDPTPGGLGQFTYLSTPKLNEAGDVAFFAQTTESGAGTGIFRGVGSGAITPIVKQGQPAPAWGGGTDGVFSTLAGDLAFNDAGAVAFSGKVNGSSSPGAAIFRSDGVDSAVMFKGGVAAPTGSGRPSGTFLNFSAPSLNNHGEVIVVANLSGTPGGSSDNRGIFVSDDQTTRQVMRNGDSAPDGNGTLSISGNPTALVLNDRGQTIFQTSHLGATPGSEIAIYFHDPEFGLKTVARMGQTLLGQSVVSVAIVEGTYYQSSSQLERSGLNELGQVAFRFTLADGAQGLALWSAWSPADFNRDGSVDATDLAAWKSNFGDTNATLSKGDANADGRVDGDDYLFWQREFSANAPPAVVQVPEPAGWVLGALAVGVLVGLGGRRK